PHVLLRLPAGDGRPPAAAIRTTVSRVARPRSGTGDRGNVAPMSAGGRGASGELWPAVTVIVPVLNGARTIAGTLDSIATQDYPRSQVEAIVVDNGSTDGSRDLVARHALPVRLLFASRRGSAAARNVGIRHASHELLAFTDADCRPDP